MDGRGAKGAEVEVVGQDFIQHGGLAAQAGLGEQGGWLQLRAHGPGGQVGLSDLESDSLLQWKIPFI